jgi:hypothetical protein
MPGFWKQLRAVNPLLPSVFDASQDNWHLMSICERRAGA